MPRRGKKRIKSLAQSSQHNRIVSETEPEAESDLPKDLLYVILCQLSLRDNIRASAVCKRWLAVATSVRRGPKHPMLMYLPKADSISAFYNPSDRKSYCLKLPALRDCKIWYSKDGWLLLYKRSTHGLFFYCPYTQQRIDLPDQRIPCRVAAFSAPPTSPSCVVVVAGQYGTDIRINTCRPGDATWTIMKYHIRELLKYPSGGDLIQVACYDGYFYCLSESGFVGFYNIEERKLTLFPFPGPTLVPPHDNSPRAKLMVEHNGNIYVICIGLTLEPILYKLNKSNRKWEATQDLRSKTIFASSINSHVRTDLLGEMGGSIYFPKVQYYGKRCIMYIVRDNRFYPNKDGYDWSKQEVADKIWIDAPEDLSVFL